MKDTTAVTYTGKAAHIKWKPVNIKGYTVSIVYFRYRSRRLVEHTAHEKKTIFGTKKIKFVIGAVSML